MGEREPVQIVNVYIPILVDAVVLAFAFGVVAMWISIFAGRI